MDDIPSRPRRDHHNKSRKSHPKHKGQTSENSRSTPKTSVTSSTAKEIDSTTEEEPNKQFSKREVSSNWNKYTENSSIDDIEVPVADFEQLLSAPSSIGGHFLLNSEKSWEGNDDWYNRGEYFQLNLVELTQSLATIPFYERQQYSKNIFSSEEIEDMDRQARFQRCKWLENNNKNASKISQHPMKLKSELKSTETEVNVQNEEDDLDELLNLPVSKQLMQDSKHQSNTNASVAVTPPSQLQSTTLNATDDIQKWLDDVLVLDS